MDRRPRGIGETDTHKISLMTSFNRLMVASNIRSMEKFELKVSRMSAGDIAAEAARRNAIEKHDAHAKKVSASSPALLSPGREDDRTPQSPPHSPPRKSSHTGVYTPPPQRTRKRSTKPKGTESNGVAESPTTKKKSGTKKKKAKEGSADDSALPSPTSSSSSSPKPAPRPKNRLLAAFLHKTEPTSDGSPSQTKSNKKVRPSRSATLAN